MAIRIQDPREGDVLYLTESQIPKEGDYEPGLYIVDRVRHTSSSTGMSAGDFYPAYTKYQLRPLDGDLNYDPSFEAFVASIASDAWTGGHYIEGGVLKVGGMEKTWIWPEEEEEDE